jgi:parvulin-like peptidyl-prolyl isomerase
MYMQFLSSYIQQIGNMLMSPNSIGQQAIDTLVESELIRQEAERRGITISSAELDEAFEEAFGFFENGTPTATVTTTPYSTSTLSPQQQTLVPPTSTPGPTEESTAAPEDAATGTPEASATPEATATEGPTATPTSQFTATATATATITPTPTPYTREGYETQVSNYLDTVSEVNYSRQDLRKLVERQVLQQKVYDAVTSDVEKTAEQVWARHILVATEEEAQQVLERLNNGENFADVAAEVSTDTSNKDQGGDLGWFAHERMVEPFSNAAFAMEVGEISEPVKTDFGYHIIQVLGHEERPLDETQLQQAQSTVFQDWLTEAKAAANVETYDATWQAAIPNDPEVPQDLLSLLAQLSNQQNQLPLENLPTSEATEVPAE